jgi:hypothetical protein
METQIITAVINALGRVITAVINNRNGKAKKKRR